MDFSLEKELTRAEIGRGIATMLSDVALSLSNRSSAPLAILSERIRLCNSNQNLAIAHNARNRDGKKFAFVSHLWSCNSKLCPACLARHSRQNRKHLREALKAQGKIRASERYSFLTLTIQNPRLSLLATRAIVNRAWCLLRKREFWKTTVVGAAKSEEFTVRKGGYHYHLHLICRRSYWSYHKLRVEWTECVQQAFSEAGLVLRVQTADQLLIVVDKPISSFESAIQEVAKYVTKASSWRDVQPSDLIDIAMVDRWPRMFELVGTFSRSSVCASDDEGSESKPDVQRPLPIVHTKHLSDGSKWSWRQIETMPQALAYIHGLHERLHRCRDASLMRLHRLYPTADLSICPSAEFRTFADALDRYIHLCPSEA